MNVSKTTSYALKVMSFMADHNDRVWSASELYDQLGIPHQYLRQIMTTLTKGGLVQSRRGRNGGFSIGKKLKKITVADIIETMEGLDSFDRCILGFTDCPFDQQCAMHEMWADTRNHILNVLNNTSLADLKKKKS
jgi:Rrf2 family iron-sulfur cluster assembly transcriptional regulator